MKYRDIVVNQSDRLPAHTFRYEVIEVALRVRGLGNMTKWPEGRKETSLVWCHGSQMKELAWEKVTVSNAADRLNKMRTENWPLDILWFLLILPWLTVACLVLTFPPGCSRYQYKRHSNSAWKLVYRLPPWFTHSWPPPGRHRVSVLKAKCLLCVCAVLSETFSSLM